MTQMTRFCLRCILFLWIDALFASSSNIPSSEEYIPLYAGTQLAFYPTNAAPGYLAVQPYLFYIDHYGKYSSHWSKKTIKHTDELSLLFSLETGISDWLDVALYLKGAYKKFGNEHSWLFGDTSIYFGFQILTDQKNCWIPDLRFLLAETFPTGKYDHLKPNKGASNAFGAGSFTTTAVLIIAKTFYAYPQHPFNLNLNLSYTYPSHASVHGLSIFGGAPDTRDTALPGSGFITNFAVEYSLNRFWALGLDIRYVHQNKTNFKGATGTLKPRMLSSEQFSLAPCLEFSQSEDLSMAIGPWFSIAGRNAEAFVGVVSNIYCYF